MPFSSALLLPLDEGEEQASTAKKQCFHDKHCSVAHDLSLDGHKLHRNTYLALGRTSGKSLQAPTSPTQSRA